MALATAGAGARLDQREVSRTNNRPPSDLVDSPQALRDDGVLRR